MPKPNLSNNSKVKIQPLYLSTYFWETWDMISLAKTAKEESITSIHGNHFFQAGLLW